MGRVPLRNDEATGGRALSRWRWRRALIWSLTLGLLAALPAWGYLWQVTVVQPAPPVQNLRVIEIYLPKLMRLSWGADLGLNVVFRLERRPEGGTWALLTETSSTFHVDAFDWTYGATYEYRVRIESGLGNQNLMLPAPTPGADPNDIYTHIVYSPGPWTTILVAPFRTDASDNQAIDSRYDLRYGNPTFLDYYFAIKTYRGGLFAGLASDNSRVGRSYLKFTLPTIPSDWNVWASSVNAYHVRNVTAGSVSVKCQEVKSNAWNQSNLKWSTAPVIDGLAAPAQSLSWTTGGPGAWVHYTLEGPTAYGLVVTHLLNCALVSSDEALTAWAYFAKKEHDAAKAPCVLYALRAPLAIAPLEVSPTSVQGGTSATGTVTLNGLGPTGGAVVTLVSSHTNAAQVPATVTVPQGLGAAIFTITTSTVQTTTNLSISGSHGGQQRQATLEVRSAGGGW